MRFKWRKWNRILHRDVGYFFFGMTIIYALSGIALNHIDDWNPSYIIENRNIRTGGALTDTASAAAVKQFLSTHGLDGKYKSHYSPRQGYLKIFIVNGSVDLDLNNGKGVIERLQRRPLFFHVNFLHYNPKKLWTWFSDLFCVALILLAVTGLFIIRGKKGITGRGAWLTSIGIIIPLILLFLYL